MRTLDRPRGSPSGPNVSRGSFPRNNDVVSALKYLPVEKDKEGIRCFCFKFKEWSENFNWSKPSKDTLQYLLNEYNTIEFFVPNISL